MGVQNSSLKMPIPSSILFRNFSVLDFLQHFVKPQNPNIMDKTSTVEDCLFALNVCVPSARLNALLGL